MIWQDFPKLTRPGRIGHLTMADGCRLRIASWPSDENSRGIVVLVNGHREYMEKYAEFIADFLKRGYAVYTLDNRGQGLSDRPLNNRLKSHSANFDAFVSDMNEFVTKAVMADPRAGELPLILVGHSMGAHVCLRYLGAFPGRIDRAILLAPMTDFHLGSAVVRKAAGLLVRLVCGLGFGKLFALGQGSVFSKKHHLLKRTLLTHDRARYAIEADIIAANPDLYVGGPTYGWLKAALDSIDKIHEPGFLDRITIPMLVLLAGEEALVDNRASERLFAGRDNIMVAILDGARHEMYRETDALREILWRKITEFLGDDSIR